jgi:hypothetical protein
VASARQCAPSFRDTFAVAQQERERRVTFPGSLAVPRRARTCSLSGLGVCASCGVRVHIQPSKGRPRAYCGQRRQGNGCTGKSAALAMYADQIDRLAELPGSTARLWGEANQEQRNRITRTLVEEVVMDDGQVVAVKPRPDLTRLFTLDARERGTNIEGAYSNPVPAAVAALPRLRAGVGVFAEKCGGHGAAATPCRLYPRP